MFRKFIADKEFIRAALTLAVPLVIQQWIQASLSFVNMVIISQLGDTYVAAVGLGNQFYFLLHVLSFGIGGGTAIFTAQYWGKKDIPSIRKTLGFSLGLSLVGGLIFGIFAVFFPELVLSFYTNDPVVIAYSSEFLRIAGLSFIFASCSFSFIAVLRSIENIKLPMAVSIGALILNTLLGYMLILGKFGFPRLDVRGAAIATTISFTVEFIALVILIYVLKTPIAAKFKELFVFDWTYFKQFFRTSAPVIFSEFFWSLGISVYTAIYARISTEALAAVNISASLEQMGYVSFIGLANACAIMVGNRIGAGEEKKAYHYAVRFIQVGIIGALVVGGIIFFASTPLLTLFQISDTARGFAQNILYVFSLSLWVRVLNFTFFIGILRSGGDTRFAFIVDIFTLWLIGIPLALIGAFWLHLPVYYIYLLVMIEELIKLIIVFKRFLSKKWINNLTFPVTLNKQ